MKKKNPMKKRKKNNFISGARDLLNSINENKRELKEVKNLELKNLNIREREEIKLVKEKMKKQRLEIQRRYEKGREDLGKILLRKKNQELGSRLSVEKKSLSKTNREIGMIGRNLKKIRK